jgi:hypothetical protein
MTPTEDGQMKEQTKTQRISKMLLDMLAEVQAQGGDICDVFDIVFGEGSYKKLAGELYLELRINAENNK